MCYTLEMWPKILFVLLLYSSDNEYIGPHIENVMNQSHQLLASDTGARPWMKLWKIWRFFSTSIGNIIQHKNTKIINAVNFFTVWWTTVIKIHDVIAKIRDDFHKSIDYLYRKKVKGRDIWYSFSCLDSFVLNLPKLLKSH